MLVYSVMGPLVTAFGKRKKQSLLQNKTKLTHKYVGVVYFGLSFMTAKYNMLYAYVPRFEGGGKLWSYLYHPFMAGVLLFQLTMLGILSVSVSGALIIFSWYLF